MNSQRRQARTAGLIYLVVAVTGIISVMVIPARYSVAGDAAATLATIAAMDMLFRLGIAIKMPSCRAFLGAAPGNGGGRNESIIGTERIS